MFVIMNLGIDIVSILQMLPTKYMVLNLHEVMSLRRLMFRTSICPLSLCLSSIRFHKWRS